MGIIKEYTVRITFQAKLHYFEILEYFYTDMSSESALRKGEELLEVASSLKTFPERGNLVLPLEYLKKEHRCLIYHSTSRATVKVIYFIDKETETVYITDFFPTEMDVQKISDRNS